MDIDEIRRINIKALEKIHGPGLAKRAGMSPAQFYNLRDGAKDSKSGRPRGMRKETAWRIEDAAGVERGYLDVNHDARSFHKYPESEPSKPYLAKEAIAGYTWPFKNITPEIWGSIPVHKREIIEELILGQIAKLDKNKQAA